MQINDYKFLGIVLPNGIIKKDKSDKLLFSVCLNINKMCYHLDSDDPKKEANYNDFYTALQSLKYFCESDKNKIDFIASDTAIGNYANAPSLRNGNPFEFACDDIHYSNEVYQTIRYNLWKMIFPERGISTNAGRSAQVNPDSRVTHFNVGEKIEELISDDDMNMLKKFSVFTDDYNSVMSSAASTPKEKINDLLKKINQYGKASEGIAYNEKIQFIKKYAYNNDEQKFRSSFTTILPASAANPKGSDYKLKKMSRKQIEAFVDVERTAIDRYINGDEAQIDIDEVINNFSAIASEPLLMRLMGLIVDFSVTLPPGVNADEFFIKINCSDGNVYSNPTQIARVQFPKIKKYALIVKHTNNNFFENSILKKDGSSIIRIDPVAQIQKQADYVQKLLRGDDVQNNDLNEALTRGLLLTNKHLAEIIKPSPDIALDTPLTDDYVVRGHRVGVRIDSGKPNYELHSLTSRSINFELDGYRKPIYHCGSAEGCIHFDAPHVYMESESADPSKPPTIKTATSNILFEYSGELLKLKSAFAQAHIVDKKQKKDNKVSYHHDGGLHKSIARFKGKIGFFHFPFTEMDEAYALKIRYDIPEHFSQKSSPKLRFKKAYSFVVYQDYLNGWGLPLKKQSGSQLSVEDLLDPKAIDNYSPSLKTFTPLENTKPFVVLHRKKAHEDAAKPMAERASLEHLVVRSDDGEDSWELKDERHILPPKIELEPAYWHNLLSEPNMSSRESYEIRLRSACKFAHEEAYDEFTKKGTKKRQCGEGCKSYCGGTQMPDFNPDRHIRPRFLTDPNVKTFSLSLSWDKEGYLPLNLAAKNIQFGGDAGLNPKSYLLRANGSDDETLIENHDWKEILEISLKKGAAVYAHLSNELIEEKKEHLLEGWWTDFEETRKKNDIAGLYRKLKDAKYLADNGAEKIKVRKFFAQRNASQTLAFTHAVREPLFSPEQKGLFCAPTDQNKIAHISAWLVGEQAGYKFSKNILADFIDKQSGLSSIGTSYARISLEAHFERLDAMDKISFLSDITPTGSLELWMRKEEYADNPEQIVMDNDSESNHKPDQPLVKFDNKKNIFSLEHKIEFTNELMAQLKDIRNTRDIKDINDAFRSLITSLEIKYDLRTTKFEEREYYLKNTSKFRGFFTDSLSLNDTKNEDFVLPKINDVMYNLHKPSELRFKVIVLNNQKPEKPEIAFAVSTIQETRDYPKRKRTVSTQKGNIVTIYLKRGRMKSGKNERIALIVNQGNYKAVFAENNFISKAGRDIVSDKYPNESEFLRPVDIHIPSKQNDYDCRYDKNLGMYHYAPSFDIEKQLWKFEIELNIKTVDKNGTKKDLHNPFVNFSLVNYQPFSVNHNTPIDDSLTGLKNDCRISDVENGTWCYLLPERKLSVFFDKPNWLDGFGEVDLTVGFDFESLHHFNYEVTAKESKWKVRSNFILTVEGSNDGIVWNAVGSWRDEEEQPVDPKNLKNHHPLLTEDDVKKEKNLARLRLKFTKWANPTDKEHSYKYSDFRIRVVEVEWFLNETFEDLLKKYPQLMTADVVNNEHMKMRYVELIY